MIRRCSKCGEDKPLDEEHFYPVATRKSGFMFICRECHKAAMRLRPRTPYKAEYARAYHLHRTYGLTMEEFDAMVEAQQGCCAVCGRLMDRISVDHSHATGEVRELLCATCNSGIGMFNDDPEVMHKAIAYLKKHQEI